MKLAILVSHAIQYQTPLFTKLAKLPQLDITVFFCWQYGIKKTYDRQFGTLVEWDTPLLEGFHFKLLKNFSPRPINSFLGQMNFGIIPELYRNKFDALLIHGWDSMTNVIGYWAARVLKIPIILHGESCFAHELQNSTLKKKLKKFILGKSFQHVAAFLMIGENNRRFYEYYGVPSNKLYWCPYTVDTDRFICEAKVLAVQREALRSAHGIQSDAILIMLVGKLIEKKRPFDLLKAFQRIKNDRVMLAFVGDGALRPSLEDYIKANNIPNVHFMGFVNQSQLPHYYTMADVLVLPSGVGETWGLVVNEAMCFSLPIVVSDHVGCAPDLVRQAINGFVFPLGDIDALALYLQRMVDNPDERARLGSESFKIIQDYTHQKDMEGIQQAILNICRSPIQTADQEC